MDAAHTYFNKTVLFLATALLMVVPGLAQQSFNLNSNGIEHRHGVSDGEHRPRQSPSPARSDSSDRRSRSRTSAPSYGTATRLAECCLGSAPMLTTPTTLYFAIGGVAQQLQPGLHTATVTLSSPGITSATITITYYANGSSSGGGTVTPSPTSVP